MLADVLVAVALDAIESRKLVELETDGVNLTDISVIEHLGQGLIRYRYSGLPNDHFIPESRVKCLRVRSPENEW